MTFLENDFEEKSFKGFGPSTEFFAHLESMCQAAMRAARLGLGRLGGHSVAELGNFLLQGELKFLHVGGGGFVTLLLGHDAEAAGLVQIPFGSLGIAESDLAADDGAGAGDLIHRDGDLAGTSGCGGGIRAGGMGVVVNGLAAAAGGSTTLGGSGS